MRYEGDVYRPPSEAHSLIIQLTIGCAHNTCTFCAMFKEKKFRVRKISEVIADLEDVKRSYPYRVERVFLADGDALITKTEDLITVLDKIYALFPAVQRVSVYGQAHDVLAKTPEELRLLREHGLEMVYIGAESGCQKVLDDIKKQVRVEETIEACQKLKAAGILVSMTLITGIGGRPDSEQHAIASAKLVTATKPEYLGLLTLHLEAGTPLADDYLSGKFEILTPTEYLREQLLFLQQVDSEGTVVRSNHISNYVALAGTLNRDRKAMIAQLEQALQSGRLLPERYRRL